MYAAFLIRWVAGRAEVAGVTRWAASWSIARVVRTALSCGWGCTVYCRVGLGGAEGSVMQGAMQVTQAGDCMALVQGLRQFESGFPGRCGRET